MRRALVIITVAMSLALVLTLALGYWQARSASETLVLGQGEARLDAVFDSFRDVPMPVSSDLELVRKRLAPSGVTYIAVVDPEEEIIAEAGTAVSHQHISPWQFDRPIRVGSRVRVSRILSPNAHPPPPRNSFLPPPPPGDHSLLDRPPEAERAPLPPGVFAGPPRVVVEFEPQFADHLERGAQVSLIVGTLTLLAFIGFSIMLFRVLKHRDDLVRKLESEKHLRALGEMSAVLAHEIRNPLASLKGHAQLLAEGLPEESRQRAKATRVVNEAIRLEQLTSDLLGFVRSGTIMARAVEPERVLKEAVDLVGEARIVVDTQTAPAHWTLDPDRMQQVLTNVVANAVQASPENTPVETSVRREGKRLVFTVRDHGQGIPIGEEERIFEPFFTKKTRGTGLGLAIARRIVTAHGGTITARNHPDGGAVFAISLPER